MTDTPSRPDLSPLKWPLRLTWTGLWAEQITRAFWPLLSILMLIVTVLAFRLLDEAGLELTWIASVIAVAGLVGSAIYAWRRFELPKREDALERLDKSMAGRPISAALDTQAIGAQDEASQSVWNLHLRRMQERLSGAKAVSPDLRVSDRDPYALRYVALLGFAVAMLFGGLLKSGSIADLTPGAAGDGLASGPSWEIWIEPPAYTGKPSLYLNEIKAAELAVPKGSDLTVRLYGQVGSLTLTETVTDTPETETEETAFSRPITKGGEITIDGSAGQTWQITTLADERPTVAYGGEIDRSPEGDMRLSFEARDDYGVRAGTAVISLDLANVDRRYGLIAEPEARESVTLDLPMPISGNRAEFSETLIENLSQHPWAGLPVAIEMIVSDASDQISETERVEVELPGRRFFQPIAKALIEQRRDILWSRENATRVGQVLRTITHKPEDFWPNQTAYVMVRMAITRMELANEFGMSVEKQDELAELLWNAAVMIEEGRLSDALERLRQAREKLSEAMESGATDEEIAELMQELQEAMRDYMQQLAQEGQQGEQQAQNQEGQTITGDQLQEMLDEIQRLMEEGDMDAAEQLLSQLMEMMQNMQVAQGQGQGQGQGEGQQAMEGLQDTLREQQGLSDEAFRDLQEQFNPGAQAGEDQQNQGRNGGQGQGQQHEGEGGEDGQAQNEGQQGQGQQPGGEQQGQGQGSLADRQEALRNELNRQTQNLPGAGTPEGDAARESLGRAGEAMDRAEEALRNDQTADALGAQSEAMDALRDGLRSLGEALAQEQQQQQGGQQGQANGGPANQQSRDPLGREAGSDGMIGQQDGDMLNGEDARRRSRDLLDEIRRRSGDQDRPEVERDYLKRLLERF